MPHDPAPGPVMATGAEELQWLPRSRAWRMALLAGVAASVPLVFAAWLHPDLLLDFANVVFCR